MPTLLGALGKTLDRLFPARRAAVARDVRGRRLVLVIECILNQNARDCGAARFPALNIELVQLCHAHRVGLLQMPCPEIAALGFQRRRQAGLSLRDALDTSDGRAVCRKLAEDVAQRVENYLAEGYTLLAVLGGNSRSPGCAVVAEDGGEPQDKPGVFIAALQSELRRRKIVTAFRGIRDAGPELLAQDLHWLRDTLERSKGPSTDGIA